MTDTSITPRSQVMTLTDSGIVEDKQTLTPLFSEMEEGGETPQATSTEQQPQETGSTTEDALRALLDQHDASQNEAPTAESSEPAKPEGLDFESPQVQKLAEQFKEVMGLDLKEAINNYEQVTKIVEEQKQRQAEMEYQQAATSLRNEWGVNDAEFDRRVTAVLQYSETLPPGLRQQFDSVKGVQLLWSQLEKRQQAQPNVGSKGDAQRSTNPTGVQTYRKSELMTMMMNNPSQYNKLQAEISRAYEAGTVIDDL